MKHISVCICTYKRPILLQRLLCELSRQVTERQFSFSVVVTDNDSAQTARQVVSQFGAGASIPVTYCLEPQQNIALARNKAVANSKGDYLAFIDDDEYPSEMALNSLFHL
jgi:glycosyltransferase involved in cell wall biosynthesis